jgi:CHAT domain-containing protein/Tfp pilus assembly protein PilF
MLALTVACSAFAAAPPARLTDEQAEQLSQSRRWLQQADRLYRAGEMDQALAALHKGLALERSVFGHLSAASLPWLGGQARVLEQRERFAEAITSRQELLRLRQELHGQGDWRVTDARLDLEDTRLLARLSTRQRQQLDQAEQWNAQVVRLWRQGRSKEALPLAEKGLATRRAILGEKHRHTGASLTILALLSKERGDHNAALRLFRQALLVIKATQGEKHPNYAASLINLAWLYQAMGEHQTALPLFQQARQVSKAGLGEKHPLYASSLNNLALLYQDMGDHKAALPLFQQALQVYKAALGQKHPEYATSLNNLALLYRDMGDHQAALPLFQQALQVIKTAQGEKHPFYAGSLNNLAALYRAMGDHKAALPLYKQALQIRKAALGEKHPDYAQSLNNLAALYQYLGEHQAALSLFQQALEVYKATLGQKHPSYALSLKNLGTLYQAMGEHKTALVLYKQALQGTRAALGEKHPLYANSLSGLALVYLAMGDHKAALALFQQALQVTRVALGEKHPSYATSLTNLAYLSMRMKQPQEAVRLSEQGLALTRANLVLSASVQSERQQLAAAQAGRQRLDLRLSLPDPEKEAVAASYQHVLAWKGAVFLHQQRRRQFARLLGSSRAEVRTLVEQLQQTTGQLAALTLTPGDSRTAPARRQQAEKLTRQKEDLESRLGRLSATFRDQQKQADLRFADLQHLLPTDAALVDFLFCTHHDDTQAERGKLGQRRLAAWVVRRDRALVRVDLGAAQPIEQAVSAWRQALTRRAAAATAGRTLHQLLWQPLVKHLEGAKTVLVSPDGVLGTVPFAALPGSKAGTYLVEDVAVAVVPVPQLLPQMLAPVPREKRLKPSLLLVGDVNFDSAQTVVASVDDRGAPRGSRTNWGKLPNTQAEVAAVRDSFTRLFRGGALTDLREEEARKAAVRQGLQKSRYAHLATHGFFAPPELKSALADEKRGGSGLFGREGVTGWHPLLLSGLVLAGANKATKPGEEDGILTALEVSELDLSGLELAVLSACETGLGEEAGGEGLLGLQRAFSVAGCRSVVASLWKVDDRATQALMASFYRAWWGKKVISRVEALRQAQISLLREGVRGMVRDPLPAAKRKEKEDRLPPYYWAAFVLSGDWR